MLILVSERPPPSPSGQDESQPVWVLRLIGSDSHHFTDSVVGTDLPSGVAELQPFELQGPGTLRSSSKPVL